MYQFKAVPVSFNNFFKLSQANSNKDFFGFISKQKVPFGPLNPNLEPWPPAKVITPTFPALIAFTPIEKCNYSEVSTINNRITNIRIMF